MGVNSGRLHERLSALRTAAIGSAERPIVLCRLLPGSPLVSVAANTNISAWDTQVVKVGLVESANVSRIDFSRIAMPVRQRTINNS